MKIIDFHSHILPGIDDGSPNVEKSLEMLREAKRQGVDAMVATSHFYASRDKVHSFLERRQKAYDKLMDAIHEDLPEIYVGAEVAFFRGISDADLVDQLTIQGTNLLMVEMPFVPWSDRDIAEIEKLIKKRKLRVIIAHLERFMEYSKNKPYIKALLELPVIVQINAESLGDWKQRRALVKMFKNGQAHILGSDCHGVNHRPPNLASGRAVLEKKLGGAYMAKHDQFAESLLIR